MKIEKIIKRNVQSSKCARTNNTMFVNHKLTSLIIEITPLVQSSIVTANEVEM